MDKMRRQIDVLLFEGVNLLDVAGPAQAFSTANIDGENAYGLRYVSADGKATRASCGLILTPEIAIGSAHQTNRRMVPRDLMIPGGPGIDDALEDSAIKTDPARLWRRMRAAGGAGTGGLDTPQRRAAPVYPEPQSAVCNARSAQQLDRRSV